MTREEAIGKWIYPAITTMWNANKCNEILEALEPKTGHWTYICNSDVNGLKICECSSCNKRTYRSHSYCPNCGAKMEEEEEE